MSGAATDFCSTRHGHRVLGADGHDGRQPFAWLYGQSGGFSINLGKTGMGTARKDDKQVNGAFYHVHWYKYPLTYWLNIITSAGCLEGGDMDIAYLSEIDPTRVDSSLTTILNPEAILFANPIAQGRARLTLWPARFICHSIFCSGVPALRVRCTRLAAG